MLVFDDGRTRKCVYFTNGEIVFAESDDPEHRLGVLLIQRGKVSAEDMNEVLAESDGGARLGARLIQKGLLRAKDLYDSVRYQVEEIIFSIFPMKRGNFFFFEGDYLEEDLAQFTLNTQNILMEGYRRLDEWGQMREQIPHEGVVLSLHSEAEPTFDGSVMERVYGVIDGKRTVREVMQRSGIGEFDVYRALYDLLKRGAIEAHDPKAVAKDKGKSLEGLLESYNRLYLIVAQALDRAGRADAVMPDQMSEFISGLDERSRAILEGIPFDVERGYGHVRRRILRNLDAVQTSTASKSGLHQISGLGDIFKRQQFQGVLDEVLNYFLFSLKNSLPPEQADGFIQKVRAARKRLRDRG